MEDFQLRLKIIGKWRKYMIFFDIDGTLLDHKTSERIGVSLLYNVYKNHFIMSEDEFYKLWIEASDKYFRKYLNREITFDEQRILRIKDVFKNSDLKFSDSKAKSIFCEYLNEYEKSWRKYDDVKSCLESLSKYKLGIISNGDLSQQLLKLEKLEIKEYFSVIVAAGSAGVSKPDTEIFKIACEKAEEEPENCYYIGDNLKEDILACMSAEMKGIWINREHKDSGSEVVREVYSLNEIKNDLFSEK